MKKYIVCFLLPLLAWGCFKDEGNYDYTDGIEIKVEGIEEDYGKRYMQQKLEIRPTVRAVHPEDRCGYLWLIYPENNTSTDGIDTIGREKDLDWTIDRKPGNYKMEFIATDCDRMDFFKRCTTKLTVATLYTEGFYVLKETSGGETDLDLYLSDRDTTLNDVLTAVYGNAFPGKPDNLGLFFNFRYIDEESGEQNVERTLNVVTEDNAYILRSTDLATLRDHSSLFYGNSDEKTYALRNIAMGYNPGVVHLSSHGASFSEGNRFGMAAGRADYPETGGSRFGFFESYAAMLNLGVFFYFDEKTGTFCTLSSSFGNFEMCKVPEGHHIPHRMLHYGAAGIDMNTLVVRQYALFEDKDDASVHYLYKLFYEFGAGLRLEISEVPAGSLLHGADRVALNKEFGFYYFVAGNRLYRYWVSEDREEALALPGIPDSEQIVLLKERYYKDLNGTPYFNYLVVGTYDGDFYKLYFYNTVGGAPAGDPVMVAEGKGKPVDIQYMTSGFVQLGGFASRNMTEVYNEY